MHHDNAFHGIKHYWGIQSNDFMHNYHPNIVSICRKKVWWATDPLTAQEIHQAEGLNMSFKGK